MTPQDKTDNFHKELKELLLKYDAELILEESWVGYASDHKIVIDFNWDKQFFENYNTGEVPQLIIGRYEDAK